MPNIFDANGLQIETREEVYARLESRFKGIYGDDINLDPSSPDRQLLEIIAQDEIDLLELLQAVNSSFDPDQAVGNTLIQRVAINGIEPQEGSYTTTDVTITTSRSVTLYGLDQAVQTVYMVSDNEGNRWLLVDTIEGLNSPSGEALAFRAEFPGPVLTVPNTITTPDTIVLGVTSVNNPTPYIALGSAQESDQALKLRRRESVASAGKGWLESMIAGLRNLSGMVSANVFENETNAEVEGVPPHGMWAITEGAVSDQNIAETIYRYRTGGLSMRGEETYLVTADGAAPLLVRWDEVQPQVLFAVFPLVNVFSDFSYVSQTPNADLIRAGLPAKLLYGINQPADMTALGTAVQEIDATAAFGMTADWPFSGNYNGAIFGFLNGLEAIFETNGNDPTLGGYKLSYGGNLSAQILHNDNSGAIQTKVRAIPGLGAATVVRSLAPYNLYIQLEISPTDVAGLMLVKENTLVDSLGDPVLLLPKPFLETVLSPSSLLNKFLLLEENVILNLQIFPASETSVNPSGSINFTSTGGYGTRTYSLLANPSGGSINASTGAYTAGVTGTVTDIVQVSDEWGQVIAVQVFVL